MSLDSMSTSHPVYKSVTTATQIDELFDSIETTKSTAILRMADYYMKEFTGIANNTLSNIVVRSFRYPSIRISFISHFFMNVNMDLSFLMNY